MKNYWRYFVVEIRNDTPDTKMIAGRLEKVMPHKEQLLDILTFRHMIRGWVKAGEKIIVCLTSKISLPSLRYSLKQFIEHYPDCEVTEVICEGSNVQMRYYH